MVGSVGVPACYGGFESLVENLTLNKSDKVEYTVFCSGKAYRTKIKEHNGAKLIYIPLHANGVHSILYDAISLAVCWFTRPNTILILGVSGCIFLPFFKLFSKAKIITNIDGLEWKRAKWSKWQRMFLKFSESIAVKYSNIIVSDNKAISDYVRDEYNVASETIAYGGDHAIRSCESSTAALSYSLGLCRIEPENNVDMILQAFSKLDKKLLFVGNWSASEYGKKLRSKYGSYSNIELVDPIYDLDELYKLRKGCDLYLHGHSAGGTNPSLVEMMHFCVPILAYDCSFNRYSTENKALYFQSGDDIIKLLTSETIFNFQENATRMREIACNRYTWKQISRDYETLY